MTRAENKRETYVYAALALVGIVARIPFFGAFNLVTFDGTSYLNEARALASFDKLPGAFPIGYPAVTALFQLVFRDWVLAGRMVSVVAGVAATLLLYRLVRERVGRAPALAAAAVLSLNPLFIRLSLMTMSEALYIFFVLLALVFVVGKGAKRPLAAGLALGAAAVTRPEGIAILGVVALFHLRVPRRLVTMLAGFAIMFAVNVAVQSWSQGGLELLSKSNWLGSATQDWKAKELAIDFEGPAGWEEPAAETVEQRGMVAEYLHSMPRELALLARHTWPAVVLLALAGMWWLRLHAFLAPLASLVFFTLFTKRPEHRYILPYIPFLILYAGVGLGALANRKLRLVAFVVLGACAAALLVVERAQLTTPEEPYPLDGMKTAGKFLRDRVEPGHLVADRKPHFAFYAGGRYVEIPVAPYEDAMRHMAANGVEWIALHRETIHRLRPAFRPLMYSRAVINGELRYDQVYARDSGEMVFRRARDADPLRWSQLTTAMAADIMPAWSPDGERLAFRRQRTDKTASLMIASRRNRAQPWSQDNVELKELVPLDDLRDPLAWSSDGERIAFARRNTGTRTDMDIVSVNVFDKKLETLLGGETDERSPSWPAAGTMFYSDARDVWVARLGTRERSQLTHAGDCDYPVASPDGARVAWVSAGKGVGVIEVATGEGAYAGAPKSVAYPPAWSPDGETITMTADDWGSWDVYMMTADATNVLLLTKHASRETMPAWHPEGRSLAIVSDRGGTFSVWLLEGLEEYKRRLATPARVETLGVLREEP